MLEVPAKANAEATKDLILESPPLMRMDLLWISLRKLEGERAEYGEYREVGRR